MHTDLLHARNADQAQNKQGLVGRLFALYALCLRRFEGPPALSIGRLFLRWATFRLGVHSADCGHRQVTGASKSFLVPLDCCGRGLGLCSFCKWCSACS
jgi:hypothetical protein